jgi:hypothetical protein
MPNERVAQASAWLVFILVSSEQHTG